MEKLKRKYTENIRQIILNMKHNKIRPIGKIYPENDKITWMMSFSIVIIIIVIIILICLL